MSRSLLRSGALPVFSLSGPLGQQAFPPRTSTAPVPSETELGALHSGYSVLSLGHINMLQAFWAEAGTHPKYRVAVEPSSTLVPHAMQALRVACSVSTLF